MSEPVILTQPTLLIPAAPEAAAFLEASSAIGGTVSLYNASASQIGSVALNNVLLPNSSLGAFTPGPHSATAPSITFTAPSPPFQIQINYPGVATVLGTVSIHLPAGANFVIWCFPNGFLAATSTGTAAQLNFSQALS